MKGFITVENLTEEYGGTLRLNDDVRVVPLSLETDESSEDPEKVERLKNLLKEEK